MSSASMQERAQQDMEMIAQWKWSEDIKDAASIAKAKVTELKQLLKINRLKVPGKKADMLQVLEAHFKLCYGEEMTNKEWVM